jgi:hypothetical protein
MLTRSGFPGSIGNVSKKIGSVYPEYVSSVSLRLAHYQFLKVIHLFGVLRRKNGKQVKSLLEK